MCLWRNKAKILFFSLLLTISVNFPANAEKQISTDDIYDKAHGMWLGQLIANSTGRPYEGKYQANPIPEPCAPVPWVIKQQWDADDDTDIEYLALHVLEANSIDCNFIDIAAQWRKHITTSGIYISNKQAWYLMGDGHLPPDTGSRSYNEHWYSIDSQITTEFLGAISPGMPQQAIDLTWRFAHVSNEGFPVHAAQLYAAMYAYAFFEPNVVNLVNAALDAIPATSRTHQVASDVLNWYIDDINDGDPDWRDTRLKLRDKYYGSDSFGRYYSWIESTVNTGATILAILYGQGDFKQTAQIAILAGWDNDCNPATAAGLIGIINGYSHLPSDLTDPNICGDVYKNVYRPYLPDHNLYLPQYDTITNIASRLTAITEQNILENNGWQDTNDPNIYHIPEPNDLITAPEKPDPNSPAGLVADAINAGITVTTDASVAYHIPTNDRRNLDAIINGITDNSYNGHKPYYTYTSNPDRTEDWYRLDFSQPVKFDSLTFYEGDIVWSGINTYYKDDETRGGFFEDLAVEILRYGKFIQPANLQISPDLDQYKMYQIISFDFAPTVGSAIRIIGTPGGAENFTTIMELEAGGDIDPGLYIASIEINDGLPQRSTISKIDVQFSRDVAITQSDIELAGTTNATSVNMNDVGFNYDSPTHSLTLSFAWQLPDDTYQLKLDCNTITDSNSLHLLDDDQNPEDDYYTIKFHNLFGDADGSSEINFRDFLLLALQWLDVPANTGLDTNNDNILNFVDLAAFNKNWLLSLPLDNYP